MIDWLFGLVAPLNRVLFQLGNDAIVAELFGFITGGWCVWLTVPEQDLELPGRHRELGILPGSVCVGPARADASLQIVFIILGAMDGDSG